MTQSIWRNISSSESEAVEMKYSQILGSIGARNSKTRRDAVLHFKPKAGKSYDLIVCYDGLSRFPECVKVLWFRDNVGEFKA